MCPNRSPPLSHARLVERLSTQRRRKLTLICAPAGFGKTTLLAEWLRNAQTPAAWVSLDASDNEPKQFWTYVLTAVDRLLPGISETALVLLQSPQPTPIGSILIALINDIAVLAERRHSDRETSEDGTYVLVLDDYHVIEAQAVHAAVSFLLDHLPPELHLVVATRADPPPSQARLRARGQLVGLRSADLRFSRSEAADFFEKAMGLSLKRGRSSAGDAY